MSSRLPPIHPGEVLKELYLRPLDMSAGALARRLGVPQALIGRVVAKTNPITPDTALRLARFFSTTSEYWMNMQASFDLKIEAAKQLQVAQIESRTAARGS